MAEEEWSWAHFAVNPLWEVLTKLFGDPATGTSGVLRPGEGGDTGPSPELIAKTQKQLLIGTIAGLGLVAAPAIYAMTRKKLKKARKLTPREEMIGVTVEHASSAATQLLAVSLASPAIAAAGAYILIQKLEDAAIISRGLGNATQSLMTVAAAGPALSAIGNITSSAFRAGK